MLKIVDLDSDNTYYLHIPVPLGSTSIAHYLISAGSAARALRKAFRPQTPDELEILEDLPWEA